MEELLIKSHLIIDSIEERTKISWCGKIVETKPLLKNGLPVFAVIGSCGRVELNTADMRQLEETAKRLAQPKGRTAVTQDTSRIYIKEVDGKETLLGVVVKTRKKNFLPMYDRVCWK